MPEPETRFGHSADAFYRFGENSFLDARGQIHGAEHISIGNGVAIQGDHWLNVVDSSNGNTPHIMIGDNCRSEQGLIISALNRVELEQNVVVGAQVFISDTDHEYRVLGKPVFGQGLSLATGEVRIGEGTRIGAGTVIQGEVRIGHGCLILPGSVVQQDIPSQSVAGGNPARVLQIYEPALKQWATVGSPDDTLDSQLQSMLAQIQPPPPVLSICIPTYNRAPQLEQCLESIFSQIGSSPLFEVIVSDNASTDSSWEVANHYAKRYPNLRLFRNAENIGADPNIYKAMNLGRGKFIKLQGDDDFFVPGTLQPLLDVVQSHSHCGVIQIFVRNGDGRVWAGTGMRSYLEYTSIFATFITSMVLRREDLLKVEEPALFLDSSFNQLYLQYAILARNPHYCIMNYSMFTYAGLGSDDYNFGEVTFRSYQSILQHFVGKGLTEEDLAREKKQTLYSYAIPRFNYLLAAGIVADMSRFEETYTELYQDEPYYSEGLAAIAAIRQVHQAR